MLVHGFNYLSVVWIQICIWIQTLFDLDLEKKRNRKGKGLEKEPKPQTILAQEKPKTQTQTQSRGPLLSLKPNPFFPHGPSFLSRGPVRPGPLSPLPFPIPAPSRPTPSFPLGPLLSPARSRPTTRFHSSVCSARSPSTWPKPLLCARPSFHGPSDASPAPRFHRVVSEPYRL